MDNFTLIHIGKCGGNSVLVALQKANKTFEYVHYEKPKYSDDKKYVIIVRDPIARFVSAFNWRHYLLTNNLRVNQAELQGLLFYKTVNNLAETLYDSDGCLNKTVDKFITDEETISHIGKNINWYLEELLLCADKSNLSAIRTEKIKEDAKELLNVEVTENLNYNKNYTLYSENLSELAIANLRRYLQKDYDCLSKLGIKYI